MNMDGHGSFGFIFFECIEYRGYGFHDWARLWMRKFRGMAFTWGRTLNTQVQKYGGNLV